MKSGSIGSYMRRCAGNSFAQPLKCEAFGGKYGGDLKSEIAGATEVGNSGKECWKEKQRF
jgi:hypothetical protein